MSVINQLLGNFLKNVYSYFKDNIWGVDLADMQLISKYNKRIRYLLCAVDLFSKYAWVVPLKDKKGVSFVNAFQSILDSSKRKPNKIWVDQGSEFYNTHFKKWLKDNNIEMYSTYNEGKSVMQQSSYATKTDLKNVTHVDVSRFASKTNLASLKTEVDKLDIAKLTPVANDLAKLSNVVKNDVVKKTEYNKLVTK